MLHIVEEAEEVLQPLKTDLVTDRDRREYRYKTVGQNHTYLGVTNQFISWLR